MEQSTLPKQQWGEPLMIETDYTTGFEAARKNMVAHQIRCCKVLDADLLDMLETMPRDEFLPENIRSLAYMEGHAPLPCGQEMLTPLQEATFLQHLQLQGHESVLLIGAGTGFMTMLLALRSAHVTACEYHADLASMAKNNLSNHGITNADVLLVNAMDADAMQMMLKKKKFDVLVIAAALADIPLHLRSRVTENGQIMAFLGSNPVVTLQHKQIQGSACITTPLLETSLLSIEGIKKTRVLDF
ncbi:MAG: methyltransferase domain-containing protein [Mariprofundaceae bacterium]|nr:methyltransferase domain-containing protein [Mariprofundaceae bacterium]